MQHHTYKGAADDVMTDLVFQSRYYTVVRASVPIPSDNGLTKAISAEGVARRSWRDSDNPDLGRDIATGRARKALALKLNGRRSRHLLMNG